MTYDKATYTVTFPDDDYTNPCYYESFAHEDAGEHVTVETTVKSSENELIVVVHGDGNVIPVYEQQFAEYLPDSVTIECDVDIGGGTR